MTVPQDVVLFFATMLMLLATPSESQCSLCAREVAPPDPNRTLLISDNTTCGTLDQEAAEANSTIGGDECNEYLLIGLTQCDCPRAGLCTLCEDGSNISYPNRTISNDYTCSDLALEALLEAEDSSSCRNWRATVGVYCGCQNPVASAGYCRICGDDLLLDNPAQSAGPNPRTTCMTLEFNEADLPCDLLQSTYSDVCCNTSSAGSNAPTQSPVPTNSSHADGTSISQLGPYVLSVVMGFLIILDC